MIIADVHTPDDIAMIGGNPPSGATIGYIDRVAGERNALHVSRVSQRIEHQRDRAEKLTAECDCRHVLAVEPISDASAHEHEDCNRTEFGETEPSDVDFTTRDVIDVLAECGGLQHHPDVEGETASEESSHRGRPQYLAGTKLHGGTCVAH
jgi:hypothetical protein